MSFLSKENIEILWDVLLEEPIIKNTNKTKQQQIYLAFYANVSIFFERERGNFLDLISLNKKFLGQMLKVLRNEKQDKQDKYEKHDKNLYKVEDIQNARQDIFEKELAKKKADFESSILVKKPPVPNFTEKVEQDKIQGMEELIARTVAQRNFDISPMNITAESEKWLRSQETSVKLKKPKEEMEEPREIKYIKIDDETPHYNLEKEIFELPVPVHLIKETKKISWSKDNEVRYIQEYKEPKDKEPKDKEPKDKEPKTNSKEIKEKVNYELPSTFNILDKLKKVEANINDKKIQLLEEKMDAMQKQIQQLFEMMNKE